MRALRSALALVLLSGLAGCAGGGYGYPSYGSSYGYPSYGSSYGAPGYYAEPGYAYGPSVGLSYGGGYPVYYGGGYPNYYHGNYPYWQQPYWHNDWHNTSWNNGHWTPPPNQGQGNKQWNKQWNQGNKQWNQGNNQGNNWQGNKPPAQWTNQNGTQNIQNPLYKPQNNPNYHANILAGATNQKPLVGRSPNCRECY
ncbi:MAG TPA: hypothetical protein VKB42_01045 [Dongiaceae bacterium]|nr:hypothetical protein [Dongiaceae bacterium]